MSFVIKEGRLDRNAQNNRIRKNSREAKHAAMEAYLNAWKYWPKDIRDKYDSWSVTERILFGYPEELVEIKVEDSDVRD